MSDMIQKSLIGIFDPSARVYRVLDYNLFREFVKTGKLILRRPHKWEDPFENILLKVKAVLKSNGDPISMREVVDVFFGQCWSLNEKETDATWRIYAPNKNGVRITTTIGKLLVALVPYANPDLGESFYFGKVTYLEKDEILSYVNDKKNTEALICGKDGREEARTLLLKRKEFEHEGEARLLFYDCQGKIPRYEYERHFPVNPNAVIDSVVFDPRMPKHRYEYFKLELSMSGLEAPISHSQLYQPPEATVEIDM